MKKVFFDVRATENWIGGAYYMRNIVFQMISSELKYKYKPVVVCSRENANLFLKYRKDIDLYVCDFSNKILCCLILVKILFSVDFIYNFFDYKINPFNTIEKKGIYWIPDFQDSYFQGLFTDNDLLSRKQRGEKVAESENPLVLSSLSCYNDFCKFYPEKKHGGVYVVPFVSAIEDEVRVLTNSKIDEILDKYELKYKKYVLISNQFWQHKNHIVVFKAIEKYVSENPENEVKFVFTGILRDYRNSAYIDLIKGIAEKQEIKKHIAILGFIDRAEQLAIMKEAEYIIQPSLFEGWGTVVEDAKVLDKTILLSDIPVHHEQKNNKCIIFDPYNETELAELIDKENQKEHTDDIEAGIADMKVRAKEYAKELEKLFSDLEKKK